MVFSEVSSKMNDLYNTRLAKARLDYRDQHCSYLANEIRSALITVNTAM